jgi:hemin uptake protein HemP
MQGDQPDSPAETKQRRDVAPAEPVPSQDLLGQRGELIIEHEGRHYRLRRTQNGKLILTA